LMSLLNGEIAKVLNHSNTTSSCVILA